MRKGYVIALALAAAAALLPVVQAQATVPYLAWPSEHCADQVGSERYFEAFYIHDERDAPKSGFTNDIRVTLYRADDTLWDSRVRDGFTAQGQHFIIECIDRLDPRTEDIRVTRIAVPFNANTNFNGTSELDCQEIRNYTNNPVETGGLGMTDVRIRYLHFIDDRTGCQGDSGFNQSSDTQSGTDNQKNFQRGAATMDGDGWDLGNVFYDPISTAHEMGHALGVVDGSAPSHCCDFHSRDYPDVMNAGYCLPSENPDCFPDNENIRKTCSTTSPTRAYRDGLWDCGLDDYFNPQPSSFIFPGSYICNHYNLAKDSLFIEPRVSRNPFQGGC